MTPGINGETIESAKMPLLSPSGGGNGKNKAGSSRTNSSHQQFFPTKIGVKDLGSPAKGGGGKAFSPSKLMQSSPDKKFN
jgi:hypothetical protein